MSGRRKIDVYIIHCDYDEGRPETYRGVYVTCDNVRFNFNITGDPEKDLESAYGWVMEDMKGVAMNSSDVDQFHYEAAQDGCFFI